MAKFQRSITYKPKIDAFLSGECIQTIRKGRKIAVGDLILFFAWVDRPYRSKWAWQQLVKVAYVENIIADRYGVLFESSGKTKKWQDLDYLAAYDGIIPPTGLELRRVLFPNLKKIPKNGEKMQIIRW